MRKILMLLLMVIFAVPMAFAQEEPNAYLRFARFSPDVPAPEIQIDGEATDTENLEYKTVGDWTAVPAGTHEISIASGEPIELELTPDTWYTVVITGSGTPTIIEETYDDLLPGTSQMVFLNALSGDTLINVNRDEVPFVTELGPAGTDDSRNSWTMIPVDSDVYDFTVDVTGEPENILADLPETDIVESDYILFAVVGDSENPEVVVDSTRLAEIEMVRGNLEAPGTIVEAANAYEILQPFAEAIETAGLTEMLSGEGPYTIFVPADFVMDDLLTEYAGRPEELAALLQSHMVEGDLKAQDIFSSETLTTLDGKTLTINGEQINNADIIQVNVPAMNGTIHVINNALTFDES